MNERRRASLCFRHRSCKPLQRRFFKAVPKGQAVGKCNPPFANDFAFQSKVLFFIFKPLDTGASCTTNSENLQRAAHICGRSHAMEQTVALWEDVQQLPSRRRQWEKETVPHGERLHSGIVTTKHILWGAPRDTGFLICQLHKIKSEVASFSLNKIPFWFTVAQGEQKPKFSIH